MNAPDALNAPMSPRLVSVVINCYNGERFLREAIDSVYSQKGVRWEIVFWDNASTDRSGDIARSYDGRLRYFRAERNTTLGAARNSAFSEARGEFIAMLDCDDVWMPDTLERLVSGMEKDGREFAACYGGVYRIDAQGQEIGRMIPSAREGYLLGNFLRRFDILPSASMVRTSVLVASCHGFEPGLTASEDVCFFMTLAADYPFHSLAVCLARYRIHEGALTNKSISRWADEWEYTLRQIRASHPGIEERHRTGFRHMSARIDYYRARYLMHSGDRFAARRLLWRNFGVDPRYLGLYLIALLPVRVWNQVHWWYHKRSALT